MGLSVPMVWPLILEKTTPWSFTLQHYWWLWSNHGICGIGFWDTLRITNRTIFSSLLNTRNIYLGLEKSYEILSSGWGIMIRRAAQCLRVISRQEVITWSFRPPWYIGHVYCTWPSGLLSMSNFIWLSIPKLLHWVSGKLQWHRRVMSSFGMPGIDLRVSSYFNASWWPCP